MPDETGIKLNALLPVNLDGLERSIERGLREQGASRQSTLAWGFIRTTGVDEMRKALDCDLFELLARAWCTARELRQYGDPGKHPGVTTIVHLGEHEFSTSVEPVLSVDFGVPPYPQLRFTLEVTAHFGSAALSVRDGCITAVSSDKAWASAQLKYREVVLHKESSPKVSLPGRFELKPPGLRIG